MEPTSANDYDDHGSQAVRQVLLEIGQVLGAYRDKFVVIGGSVPWLLLPQADPAHIGTMDIDLSLDPEALGDGQYKSLIDLLAGAGYQLAAEDETLRNFQLRRTVAVEGQPIPVIIDFLMPREANPKRNIRHCSPSLPCRRQMALQLP